MQAEKKPEGLKPKRPRGRSGKKRRRLFRGGYSPENWESVNEAFAYTTLFPESERIDMPDSNLNKPGL